MPKLTPVFWQFWGQKSRFLDFLRYVLELFRNGLDIVFGLESGMQFQPQRLKNQIKNQDFLSKFGFWEGDFWPFLMQKKTVSGLLKFFGSCWDSFRVKEGPLVDADSHKAFEFYITLNRPSHLGFRGSPTKREIRRILIKLGSLCSWDIFWKGINQKLGNICLLLYFFQNNLGRRKIYL